MLEKSEKNVRLYFSNDFIFTRKLFFYSVPFKNDLRVKLFVMSVAKCFQTIFFSGWQTLIERNVCTISK